MEEDPHDISRPVFPQHFDEFVLNTDIKRSHDDCIACNSCFCEFPSSQWSNMDWPNQLNPEGKEFCSLDCVFHFYRWRMNADLLSKLCVYLRERTEMDCDDDDDDDDQTDGYTNNKRRKSLLFFFFFFRRTQPHMLQKHIGIFPIQLKFKSPFLIFEIHFIGDNVLHELFERIRNKFT